MTFAGDGPARPAWEAAAARLMTRQPGIRIAFPGWLERERIDTLMSDADLLVLPSLWPEPFALVGLEAARHHLPVAAFAVGGIPDWLRPGMNGYLAPGDPPTAAGLAGAIVACLRDPRRTPVFATGRPDLEELISRHLDALLESSKKPPGEVNSPWCLGLGAWSGRTGTWVTD